MNYETEAHTVFLGANFKPNKKLHFFANLAYTIGEGSIVDFYFDGGKRFDDVKLDYNVSSLNPNMPYLYDLAYVNGFEDYSNLKFKEIDINLGMNYELSKNLGLGLHYYYNKLTDDEEYVYGDQSITLNSLLGFVTFRY